MINNIKNENDSQNFENNNNILVVKVTNHVYLKQKLEVLSVPVAIYRLFRRIAHKGENKSGMSTEMKVSNHVYLKQKLEVLSVPAAIKRLFRAIAHTRRK
jgi:hypothetical protein